MTVPQLVNIYPAAGVTYGGALVRLLGGDFASSIAVEFDGAASPNVRVINHALAYAVSPPTPLAAAESGSGEGLVDVAVRNLDDDGEPVPGEAASLANAFSYLMPTLALESDLGNVVRALVGSLKQHVIDEVVLRRSIDYATDAGATAGKLQIAKLPSLAIVGPTIVENRSMESNEYVTVEVEPGRNVVRRPPFVCDLQFRLVGAAAKTRHHLSMLEAVLMLFERNTVLRVPRERSLGPLGYVEYDVDFVPGGAPTIVEVPDMSNVSAFSGNIFVYDVMLSSLSTAEGAGAAVESVLDLVAGAPSGGVALSSYGMTNSYEPLRRAGRRYR